jgi:hypothetical protein
MIGKIDKIVELQPLINALGNPHMKEEHWRRVL